MTNDNTATERTATGAHARRLTVAFDADDTLWHNEGAFAAAEAMFDELVSPWAAPEVAQTALLNHERRRVELYGYGVKSFTLSMIATAIELSGGDIPAHTIGRFIETADELLSMETVMIDGAVAALREVCAIHDTMIITKGDLHHQLRRIKAAGIGELCRDVEVVAEKDTATYQNLLRRHDVEPGNFVMIGNSVVSDIAPVIEVGGRAIHIPYETTWALEQAVTDPPDPNRWVRLDDISHAPAAVAHFASEPTAETAP